MKLLEDWNPCKLLLEVFAPLSESHLEAKFESAFSNNDTKFWPFFFRYTENEFLTEFPYFSLYLLVGDICAPISAQCEAVLGALKQLSAWRATCAIANICFVRSNFTYLFNISPAALLVGNFIHLPRREFTYEKVIEKIQSLKKVHFVGGTRRSDREKWENKEVEGRRKNVRCGKRRGKIVQTLLLTLFNTSSIYVSMRKRLPAQDIGEKRGFYVRPKFICTCIIQIYYWL